MVSKSTATLVVLAIVVTWLLISSIGQINSPASQGGGTGNLNGGKGNHGSGSNSGYTFSFPSFPGFTLPFSITLPGFSNLFNVQWPSLSPEIHTVDLYVSFFNPFSQKQFQFFNPFNGINHGLGNLLNTQVFGGGTQNFLKIPDILLYAALGLVIVALISTFVVRIVTRDRSKGSIVKGGEMETLPVLNPESTESMTVTYSYATTAYPGWNQGDHFLKPAIPSSYPLVAMTGEELIVGYPKGTVFNPGSASLLKSEDTQAKIGIVEGCNLVNGIYQNEEDSLHLRGVIPGDEIIRMTEANIISGGNVSNTVRELVRSEIESGRVKDAARIDQIVRAFERVRYGGKQASMKELREYFDNLRESLASPLAIICNGES